MIIYNNTWLTNLRLHKLIDAEQSAGCLTKEEAKSIKKKYEVGFYMPGIFIRIGSFILTFFIALVAIGLFSMLIYQSGAVESFGYPIFLGIGVYTVLEMMIKPKHYYRSGVDDALLWMSAALVIGGIALGMHHYEGIAHDLLLSLMVFLISITLTLRFADSTMAGVACLSLLAIVYFGWQGIGAFGVATLPFIIMIASSLTYFQSRRLTRNPDNVNYSDCLIVTQSVSLAVLYLAGNYYIVAELSSQLNGAGAGKHIPFGFFFWGWTMLLPFVFLIFGIKKKDSILLRIGLFLVAAAIATFRNYYHVLPADIALTIGGAIILAAMYAVVRYLKTPKHGITYADTGNNNIINKLNTEALITAQTFGHAPGTPAKTESKFGGGSFGGGGSSSGY